uniref:Rad21_Rec8_N domain-containing protein n=1 Tax=Heterorhabditis bacteriophora TaxID=37862 RepID=A0A1I7WVZ7_HETBA
MNLQSKIVRAEIAEVLKSGRSSSITLQCRLTLTCYVLAKNLFTLSAINSTKIVRYTDSDLLMLARWNCPNSCSLLIPLGRRSLSTDLPREDLEDKTLGDIPVQEDYLSSLLSNGLYEESTLNPMLTPNQADIQMQSTDTADHIHDRNSLGFPVSHSDDFGNGNKEDTVGFIVTVNQAEISVSNQVSPAPFGIHHGNPAGVIGTPVKGRGGVAKSEDEGEKWKW